MNSRNKKAILWPLLFAIVLAGCTVIPKGVTNSAPSFDGSEQNSGLVGQLTNHFGVITPHARDRYNGLISDFGKRFSPPLTFDAGVTAYTNGTFLIDPEHLVKFATMNRWRKERAGAAP